MHFFSFLKNSKQQVVIQENITRKINVIKMQLHATLNLLNGFNLDCTQVNLVCLYNVGLSTEEKKKKKGLKRHFELLCVSTYDSNKKLGAQINILAWRVFYHTFHSFLKWIRSFRTLHERLTSITTFTEITLLPKSIHT